MSPRIVLAAAVVVASIGLAAPAPAAPAPAALVVGPTTFTEPGPYAVGERTAKLHSGIPVEIWYPARAADVAGKPMGSYDLVDWLPPFLQALLPPGASVAHPSGGVRGALGVPVARGSFPLVVFSHGYAGFRDQSTFLTAALASWGFVVAAPDHPSRDLTRVLGGPAGATTDVQDLRATITLMAGKAARGSSAFRDRVDLTRVAALGHSAGGSAVEKLAAIDRRVDTFIGMAGASVGALDQSVTVPHKPGLLITGSADTVVPLDEMRTAYAAMHSPKRFVVLDNAGHLVFSDICEIGADQGGLLSLAALLGVPIPDNLRPLATDGCFAPDLPPTEAWPAVEQVVIAQLRNVLGIDATDAGLTGLPEAFPGIVSESVATTPRSASPRG
ncbi:alpha/beta hydrolase family protein [Nocardioides sp. HB32]